MGIEEVTGRIAADLEHLKQYTATPGEAVQDCRSQKKQEKQRNT